VCIRHNGVALQAVGAVTLQATMDTDGKESEVYRRWDDGFLVRRMRWEDVRQVYKWIETSGDDWDWGVSVDLELAFEMRGDDDSFCVGELNGEMIASLVVTQVIDIKKLFLRFFYFNVKNAFFNVFTARQHSLLCRALY